MTEQEKRKMNGSSMILCEALDDHWLSFEIVTPF